MEQRDDYSDFDDPGLTLPERLAEGMSGVVMALASFGVMAGAFILISLLAH
jgi:hypothetical protein